MPATHERSASTSARRWIFWSFLALAAFYLVVEHRAHLSGALSWLPLGFLLLCPLLHMGMHVGHGSHGRSTRRGNTEASPSRDTDAEGSENGAVGHTTPARRSGPQTGGH
ncbi:MAG: DUF2933 domain-containing protein [Rhodanobacter sp.]|nr:DUF2933 domain-containing protein [Rhodanobacter sp.]